MEQDSARVADEGENQTQPTGSMTAGTESASEKAGTPQHDLESASAPNEDWGLDTLPEGRNAADRQE